MVNRGKKQRRKKSKSSLTIQKSSSSSSTTLVTSTPKTNEVKPFNSSLQTLYDQIQIQIDKNENKMIDCSNTDLLNYYIQRNKCLSEQQTILLQQSQQVDSSALFKISEQQTILLQQSQQVDLSALFKKIADIECHLKKLRISKIKELDIWPGNRTQIEQAEFKDQLIIKYECGYPNQNTIKCMVLNAFFRRDAVRASHIWKYSTHGTGLTEFGLRYGDLNSYRNGLLMYTSIEQAFDRKELCFVYNPFQGKLLLKVLHKDGDGIMESMILDKNDQKLYKNYTQFKDIDGKPLNLPENIYPFRRLLNWHARCAHEYAKTKKWIPENDNFDDFYDLSDLVSLPGDDLDE
jgi:hypothetical protein